MYLSRTIWRKNKKLTRELASLLQQEYQKLVEDSHRLADLCVSCKD